MKNLQQVNQYLADLSVWNVKLHNLHFNVTGPQFKSIHEYLESIYDEAFEYFDAVAEHVKMQGQFPLVNSAEYAKLTKIEELVLLNMISLKTWLSLKQIQKICMSVNLVVLIMVRLRKRKSPMAT